MAKLVGDARYAIVTDLLGTPTAMYDGAGPRCGPRPAISTATSSRGRASAPRAPSGCPGQYEDSETGLYYNRFRYYDPALGQYVSQDPIGLAGGPALYAYTHDSTTWADPLGLSGYDFATLMHMAQNTLDFSTARNGAVFWSGPNMGYAQAWAAANGRTTLEQTTGGRFLDRSQALREWESRDQGGGRSNLGCRVPTLRGRRLWNSERVLDVGRENWTVRRAHVVAHREAGAVEEPECDGHRSPAQEWSAVREVALLPAGGTHGQIQREFIESIKKEEPFRGTRVRVSDTEEYRLMTLGRGEMGFYQQNDRALVFEFSARLRHHPQEVHPRVGHR